MPSGYSTARDKPRYPLTFTTAASGTVPSSGGGVVNFLRADGSWVQPPGTASSANPSAQVGLSAVNGVAGTFMTSDSAPPLSQAISPTWSGNHTFSNAITFPGSSSGSFQIQASSTGSPEYGGTITNDNALAGTVGEYVVSTVLSSAPVGLTNNVTSNITSISLTAGDWDVGGGVGFSGGGTTTVSLLSAGVSSTTATFDTSEYDRFFRIVYTGTPTVFGVGNPVTSLSPTRMSLSTTTTIFLVATATFGTSTCSAFGTIRARRVR